MQIETNSTHMNRNDTANTFFHANLLSQLSAHKEISRLDVFKNISTVNMDDFYTEFPSQAHKKRKIEDAQSVSQFLSDYPIIKNNAVMQCTSDLNDTADNTEEVHVNLTNETIDKKPCNSSTSTAVEYRILEKLQESSCGGPCVAFYDPDCDGVDVDDGKNKSEPSSGTNAFPADKDSVQSTTGKVRSLASDTLVNDCKTKEKHSEKSCFHIGKLFGRCVGKRDSGHTHIDEHFPKAKKLRTDVHSMPRENDHSSGSHDASGWTQKVFERWGQKKNSRPGETVVVVQKKFRGPEVRNETPSSITSNSNDNQNAALLDRHPADDKEDKKKKFRKWLTERATCWSRKDKNKPYGETKAHSSVTCDSPRPGLVVEEACAINNESLYSGEAAVNYGTLSEEDSVLEEEEDEPPTEGGSSRPSRLRPRNYRQFLQRKEHRTRAYLKQRSHVLGRWFVTHFTHPYPSKEQKDKLAKRTNMSRNQVSEWFGNMRRRIRDTTRDLAMCWEERVLRYNSLITGKSEPLPIEAHDSINAWKPQDRLSGLKGWITDEGTPVLSESVSSSKYLSTAIECRMKNSSTSTNFKKGLLHRYLNDSSENLQSTPSSASETETNPEGVQSVNRRSKSVHLDVRSKTEVSHSVPVARIDPWPSPHVPTNKLIITQIPPKSKSVDSINANQIIVPFDQSNSSLGKPSRLRTYSRNHRGKSASTVESSTSLAREGSASLPFSSNLISYGAVPTFQFFPIAADSFGSRVSNPKDFKSLTICPTAAQTLKPREPSSFSLDYFPARKETPTPSTSTGNSQITPRSSIFQSSKTFHGNAVLPLSPVILSEKLPIPCQRDRTQFPCNLMIIPSTTTSSQSFQKASHSKDASFSRSSDELSAAYTLMQLQKM
ncbi:Homeobox KN domain [Trinorchestia longiramus]|nr:Homeobox KN domain [Trinorchestia longiramus]